jgi:hypothetical protein
VGNYTIQGKLFNRLLSKVSGFEPNVVMCGWKKQKLKLLFYMWRLSHSNPSNFG